MDVYLAAHENQPFVFFGVCARYAHLVPKASNYSRRRKQKPPSGSRTTTLSGANRERWLLEREYDLFDVPHHVTFTGPFELRALFMLNKKLLYNVLFKSMWGTLSSF